jgi:K+-sensing histidine kinase KdpD
VNTGHMQSVINMFAPSGVVPRGVYLVVRGSIYIVEIVPNYSVNYVKYRITESLQSFIIYNYFFIKPICSQRVSPITPPPVPTFGVTNV